MQSVKIRRETYETIDSMSRELSKMLGRRVTKLDVIDRMAAAYADQHEHGRWLSPSEASEILERRAVFAAAHVAGQLLKGAGVVFDAVEVDDARRTIRVVMGDQALEAFDGQLRGDMEKTLRE